MNQFTPEQPKNVKIYTEYDLIKYKLANDALGIALWDMDVETADPESPNNKITWSQELRNMLGFSDENDFPNTIIALADRFHPDDSAAAFAAFAAHFNDRTGKTPYNILYRLKHKNGEYRWFQGLGTTLRDGEGVPLKVAGAVMDVNEIKQIEAEKAEALDTMKRVMDELDAIIYVTDPVTSEILFMNESMRRLYKIGDDVAGHICYKILQQSTDKRCDFCPRHKLDKDPNSVVVWEFTDKFTQRIYRKTDRYIKWLDGKTAHLQQSVDITDLSKANLKAQDANRAKSNFLSNMSHEIRTPMNSIIGFTELAFGEEMSQKTKGYLDNIMENSKLLLQIINDILDISKIESGNMTLETIPFGLNELLANCQSIIYPKAAEKHLEVNLYSGSSIRKKLLGDPLRLRQVLLNLLSNAVKFTESGQVNLSANISDLSEDTVTLCFEVSDSGIGMTQEQVTKIFEPFTQADVSTTRKYGGTGLGMTITKNILTLMNSSIEIESKPGAGTKFSFFVKFGLAADAIPEFEHTEEVKKPIFRGDILIIEDNVMNQKVITEHLSRVGLRTEVAGNGLEGIEKVKRRIENGVKPYDIIFLDIHMPVMDGFETIPKIIALGAKTPVIAMTADVLTENTDDYIKFGMVDYLGKPFKSKELWDCLLRHLQPVGFEAFESHSDILLQNRLKAEFVKNNQNTFDELTKAIDDGNIKLAHRLAHTIKSSAGLIGALDLQRIAAEIESELKNGRNMVSDTHISIFQYEIGKVLNDLRPFIKKAEDSPEIPHKLLSADAERELFDKLEPMLHDSNLECIEYTDELRRIPGSGELIEQMEDFYFGAAAKTLAALRKARGVNNEK